MDDLHAMWHLDVEIEGCYVSNYQLLQNELIEERASGEINTQPSITLHYLTSYELQPMPDFIRWLRTCELHYLPLNKRVFLPRGPWDKIPACFCP